MVALWKEGVDFSPQKRDESGDEPTVLLKSSEIVSEVVGDGEFMAVIRIVETVEKKKRTRYCVKDLASGYWRTKERLNDEAAWTQSHGRKGRWATKGEALSKIKGDKAKREGAN